MKKTRNVIGSNKSHERQARERASFTSLRRSEKRQLPARPTGLSFARRITEGKVVSELDLQDDLRTALMVGIGCLERAAIS
jgi:hypothetical protein